MKKPLENIKASGRFLGVFVLVIFQTLVGIMHIFFGSILLFESYVSIASSSTAPLIYSYYTLVFGLFTIVFTYLFWIEKRSGWLGTTAISLFVIVADILALLDFFNVLGIPNTAGLGEIPYSLFVLFYLFENHIRLKYRI